MHALNIFDLPLNGKVLIESSAGTGKTFTIIMVCLRLILGINTKYIYKKPLSIKKILILTYTHYGSLEIKKKLYEKINILLISCIKKKCLDNTLLKIFKKINNFKKSIKILLKTKTQINNTSIFTIHVFCKKILDMHTLEFKIPLKYKLLENKLILYKQSVINFWRKYFYKLDFNITKYILYKIKTPDNLFKIIAPWLDGQFPKFLNKPIKKESILLEKFKEIINIINNIKIEWNNKKNEIISIILSSKINKRIYNKRNLSIWCNKITDWVNEINTTEFSPKSLKYFRKNIIDKDKQIKYIHKYKIFNLIENFFKKKKILYNYIISFALIKTRKIINKEKKYKNIICFDDLINIINKSIKNKNFKEISKEISKKYPVTIIDEFQDTDYSQFKIFDNIYKKKNIFTLLLVGDPKQSIYDFRNADIFSYIKITSKIKKKIKLLTNWRSSYNTINGINKLFSKVNQPFILNDIKYIPSKYNTKNSNLSFILHDKIQPAINIWYTKKQENNSTNDKITIAKKCAYKICSWLNYSKINKATITNKNNVSLPICKSDITILVNNSNEAKIICKVFEKNNLSTLYISKKNNIYSTKEAKDILTILKTIIHPEDINKLKNSLITNLIKVKMLEIKQIKINEKKHYKFIKIFKYYSEIWKKFGIISLFNIMLVNFNLVQKNNILNNNEQKIINILHIGELLHKVYYKIKDENNLVNYLEQKILNNKKTNKNEQIRYNNLDNKIKVMTIHQAKGLEFPIVWIPFILGENKFNKNIYHNRNNFKKTFTCKKNILMEEELLSERIRKFYVAITRSIYNCNVVIKLTKLNKETDLKKKNELNHLINKKTNNFKKYLMKFKKEFKNNEIIVNHFKTKKNIYLDNKKQVKKLKKIYYLTRILNNIPKINSFSSIKKQKPNFFNSYIKNKISKNNILTPHTFPKGKYYGKFLHKILENINFNKQINFNFIKYEIKNIELNEKWTPIIINWLKTILNKPLNNKNICLSNITENEYKKEITFHIKIKKYITKKLFNKIIQNYDCISAQAPLISFNKLSGILTGAIDMIFCWKNKYYIIDYKSNWLGENKNSYSNKKIINIIINNRYDIQYQIYSLALHKYLKMKIKNYKFKKNFGGVFYLFIRGINNENKNGIFFKKINVKFINKLNKLFK